MATVFAIPIDNVSTLLTANYTSGGTSVDLTPGTGALFGTPTSADPVIITLIASSAVDILGRITDRTKVSHLKCTGRSTDTLTGLTNDSGTAQNFVIGDIVAVTMTASSQIAQNTAINTLEALVNPLPIGYGGTGQTTAAAGFDALSGMTTLGDVLYGGVAGTRTRLAGNVSTTNKFLAQVGGGSTSAAPAWVTILDTDLPGHSASLVTSGLLATARGGTGVDSSAAANGKLLIGNGSGLALANVTAGTNIAVTNGAGTITIATTSSLALSAGIGVHGVAAPSQGTALGTTSGFTAGSGTAAKDDSTFTGGSGSSAYTVGDLVRILKLTGLIAT